MLCVCNFSFVFLKPYVAFACWALINFKCRINMCYVCNILSYTYMNLLVLLPYIVYVCVVSYCVLVGGQAACQTSTAGIIQNLRDSKNLRLEPSALRPVLYRTRRRPAGKLFICLFLDPHFISAIAIANRSCGCSAWSKDGRGCHCVEAGL